MEESSKIETESEDSQIKESEKIEKELNNSIGYEKLKAIIYKLVMSLRIDGKDRELIDKIVEKKKRIIIMIKMKRIQEKMKKN